MVLASPSTTCPCACCRTRSGRSPGAAFRTGSRTTSMRAGIARCAPIAAAFSAGTRRAGAAAPSLPSMRSFPMHKAITLAGGALSTLQGAVHDADHQAAIQRWVGIAQEDTGYAITLTAPLNLDIDNLYAGHRSHSSHRSH